MILKTKRVIQCLLFRYIASAAKRKHHYPLAKGQSVLTQGECKNTYSLSHKFSRLWFIWLRIKWHGLYINGKGFFLYSVWFFNNDLADFYAACLWNLILLSRIRIIFWVHVTEHIFYLQQGSRTQTWCFIWFFLPWGAIFILIGIYKRDSEVHVFNFKDQKHVVTVMLLILTLHGGCKYKSYNMTAHALFTDSSVLNISK